MTFAFYDTSIRGINILKNSFEQNMQFFLLCVELSQLREALH